MNVVMVGSFGLDAKGTMSARALPLARALTRRGHRIKLVLPAWDSPADSGRAWVDAGVEIQCVSLDGTPIPRSSIRVARRLVEAALVDDPDLLHLFKPIGYSGIAGMWVARKRRRPVLIYDLDDLEGRGGWGSIVSRWPGEIWFREWQERWALRDADGLTVASQYLYEMARSAGMPAERVAWIPNGCDARGPEVGSAEWARRREAARTRHNLKIGAPVVLWSTRFHEVSLDRVIRILSRVVEALPNVRILVAGQGREEADWRHLVETNAGLRDNVACLGWLPAEEWEDLVLAADVGILPLDDTVINQARCPAKIPRMMALGLPLVVDDVGEASTYIANGETGCLVLPGDDNAFVEAALDLVELPARRQSFSLEAGRRAARKRNWDILSNSVDWAYQRALVYSHGR